MVETPRTPAPGYQSVPRFPPAAHPAVPALPDRRTRTTARRQSHPLPQSRSQSTPTTAASESGYCFLCFQPSDPPYVANDRCTQFLADAVNHEFHCIAFNLFLPCIKFPFQLAARQDRPWPHQQRAQQSELTTCQPARGVSIHGDVSRCVEREIPARHSRIAMVAESSRHGSKTREKSANFKWLSRELWG